jgi:acyl carrier protein
MGREQLTEQVRHFLHSAIRSIGPELANALTSDDLLFTAIGMDSIQATELSCAIADTYRLNVPATVAFDHPTIDRLTAYVVTAITATRVRARASTHGDRGAVRAVGGSSGPNRQAFRDSLRRILASG